MDFLKKLITKPEPQTEVQPEIVNEAAGSVEIDVPGQRVGDYLIVPKSFYMTREPRGGSRSHGVIYSNDGGSVEEIVVDVIKDGTTHRTTTYINPPTDSEDLGPENIRDAEVEVNPSTDPETDGFIMHMVKGYLMKNIQSLLDSTLNSETDEDEMRRQRMRSNRGYSNRDDSEF